MTLDQIIRANQTELEAINQEGIRALKPVFDQAREELALSLAELSGLFTVAQRVAVLAQVQDAIRVIEGRIAADVLAPAMDSALAAADGHIVRQAEALLKPLNAEAVRINVRQADFFLNENTTLLERHAKYSKTWSQAAVKRIKATLAQSSVQGKNTQQVIDELTRPRGILDGQRISARRLVVTETQHAYNSRTQTRLENLAQAEPLRLRKRLRNRIDNRTATDTYAIIRHPDNLVKEVNERFYSPERGKYFLHPPDRPNDRAIQLPYWGTPEEEESLQREIKKAAR